jgi:hypothetical protein
MTPAHADHPPSLAPLLARFYDEAPLTVRVRLLNGLLRPVGPLALVALAAGAFGALLPRTRWRFAVADLGDALRIDAGAVFELARYVEQKCPEWLAQLPDFAGDSTAWAATLSGTLLLAALRCWPSGGAR